MLAFLVRLVIRAAIISIAAAIVPGIHVHGGVGWLLVIALIFAIVNFVLKPVFVVLGLPLIIVTFGLFLIVINAALLGITAALSDHLDIDNAGSAFLGAIIISLLQLLVARIRAQLRRDEPPQQHRQWEFYF